MSVMRSICAFGGGVAFATVLLGIVECYLHTDSFLYRYRSVFAVGRAMDKVRYVETHPPLLLIAGNSRVDNAFDSSIVQESLPGLRRGEVFNLGMPGADARALYGILVRFAAEGLFGPNKVTNVVIGLDESFLQGGDALGYGVFYADRDAMWREGEYVDLARSWLRLWGFSDNLKELREPAKLQRFAEATFRSIEPIGGGAATYFGYRAGFGGLQDAAQAASQEAGSKDPPDPHLIWYFQRCLDLLASHHVATAVVYPPLLNREVLYLSPSDSDAKPYLAVATQLATRGVKTIALDPGGIRDPAEFINPGHLNDQGAKRFSSLLAQHLRQTWPDAFRGTR